MKKLLLVFAIAAFVACNDSGNTEEGAAQDTAVQAAPPAPVPDTTNTADTTAVSDTTVKK